MKNWFMNTPWAPFVVGPGVLLAIVVSAILFTPMVLLVIPATIICLAAGFAIYVIRDVVKSGFFK